MTLFDLITTGVTFITFFIGVALLVKPSIQGLDNRLLAFGFFIISATFSYIFLRSTGLLMRYPSLLRAISPLMYLIGPLFYLYIRNGMRGANRLSAIDWLHSLPAMLHFLELIPFYLLDIEVKRQLAMQIENDINVLFRNGSGLIPITYHYLLRIVSLVIYALLIYKIVFTNYIQYPVKPYFKWIKAVSITYILFILLLLGIFVNGYLYFDPNLGSTGSLFLIIFLSLLVIIAFGIYLYSNQDSYEGIIEADDEQFSGDSSADGNFIKDYMEEKYGDGKGKELAVKVEEIVCNPIHFKNHNLKVLDISIEMGLPSRDIAYVLNRYSQTRLTDLVNKARVSEAKKLMKMNAQATKTIDAIGHEAGFNSRSNFYRIFKQLENCSPNEYCQNKAKGQ